MRALLSLLAPAQKHSGYRADIEGLRGIAVLLVLFYHAGFELTSGGFIGVDVFFVLSGYLITGLLSRRVSEGRGLGITDFYARRVRRLLPASLLVFAATCLLIPFAYPPLQRETFAETGQATALYFSNIWFMLQTSDYFGGDVSTNPFLHTWSLAVEEQFYLVWPLLLWVAFLGRGTRRRAFWLLSLVGLVSWGAAAWQTVVFRTHAFYLMPLRGWEFAAGGVFAVRERARDEEGEPLVWTGLLGFVAVLLGAAAMRPDGWFPGFTGLIPTLGTVAVLLSGERRSDQGIQTVLEIWPLQVLGRLSYSMYLWHWPVWLMLPTLVPSTAAHPGLWTVAVSVGLAAVTYVLVEYPIRHNRWLASRPQITLTLALLVTLLAATRIAPLAQRTPANPSVRDWMQSWAPAGWLAQEGAPSDHPGPEAGQTRVPCPALPLTEEPATGATVDPTEAIRNAANDVGGIYGTDCQLAVPESTPRSCTFGRAGSKYRVVLFGDSHASHWFPAIEAMAEHQGWQLTTHIKAACAVAGIDVWLQDLDRPYTECSAWREAVIASLAQERPDLVVVSESTMGYIGGPPLGVMPDGWAAGLRSTFPRIAAATNHLVVIKDAPRSGQDVPTCLSNAQWRGEALATCDIVPGQIWMSAEAFAAEREALADIPGLTYLDLTDLFCAKGTCPVMSSGIVRYRDAHHLTASFVESLSDAIEARVLREVSR